jgi:hypothetical protein
MMHGVQGEEKRESADYMFRSRKKVAPEQGQGGGAVIETKDRCKACGHEWRVRTPASARRYT